MSKINIEQSYPLSPMQQGMLFHFQLEPEAGVDIEQMVCSLNEKLNISALKESWDRVSTRHPALRTSIRWEGISTSVQDVHPDVSLPFKQRNIINLSEIDQQRQLTEYLKLDRRRGFNLIKVPLMRLMLFQLDESHYKLIWTFHHIIADGRSHYIILNEVFTLYDAICQNKAIYLKSSKPYGDYIEWLQQMDLSGAEIFWRRLLKGFKAPTAVDIIPKTEISCEHADNRADQEVKIEASLTTTLRNIAEDNDISLNTLVQGAWAILLSHYTCNEDVLFGAVRACRSPSLEGAKSSVGLFINTLPVRIQVFPNKHLISFLKELRKQHIKVRDYEHTPLINILGWSDIPSGTSLFDSLVVFDNYELNSKLREGSTNWQNRKCDLIEKNIYPITLYGVNNSQLLLKIAYNTQRFDTSVVKRMLGHLTTILKEVPDNINAPISNLTIITEEEKHLLLNEWNNTFVDFLPNLLIHQLFESQAEQSPNDIAVVFEDKQLTYKELNRQANQLAHYLQSIGVGPEVLVGISVERSLEMVVGLYAILKAGGAYVPIDPTYPVDRISYMLENSQISVLLSQENLLNKLPIGDVRVVSLDSDWENLIANHPIGNPVCSIKPENLAYTIFTSGSTGKPKGVMNTHRGILNRLLWMQEAFQLNSSDRVLQKTPFSFDVSVWEFFWPLMFGARLVMARPEGHKDNEYLVQIIKEQNITTLHFVPSMLRLFLETKDLEQCNSVRQVICSGEALPVDLQERFFDRFNAKLHNLYGPTEAAVDVTFWECKRESTLRTVPIGRPIANTRMYILDKYMRPVPIGIPGELHIGGIQVARGYINRPELTAEQFIPDTFSDNKEARLYKTGDQARYLADGNIEYLGRYDHQVKVRGFRIELTEIESFLIEHPQVLEAIVVAKDDSFGSMELIGYVVPIQGEKITVESLNRFLRDVLPEYMTPGKYVLMNSFPLTPNGKVDRKALPDPATERPETEQLFIPPSNVCEKKLSNIWCQVLRLDQVGIRDNFFDLGGNSLLSLQVINLVNQDFGVDISVTKLFQYPTISSFTKALDQGQENHSNFHEEESRAHTRRQALMKRKQHKRHQ